MREKGSRYILCVVLLACVAGMGLTPNQDAIRLEQRINQLEQRLYGMETTLRNVEQQSRLGGTTSRNLSEQELALAKYASTFPEEAVLIATAQEEFENETQRRAKRSRSEVDLHGGNQER